MPAKPGGGPSRGDSPRTGNRRDTMPSSHCQYKRLSEVDAETIQRMGWAETEKRLRLTRQHPSVFPPPVTPAEFPS